MFEPRQGPIYQYSVFSKPENSDAFVLIDDKLFDTGLLVSAEKTEFIFIR